MNPAPATDLFGRKLYGNHVHQDFYPWRWVPAPILIWLMHFVIPSWATMIAVLVFSFLFIRNQAVMEPRDYVHPPFWPSDLRRAYRAHSQGRADKL